MNLRDIIENQGREPAPRSPGMSRRKFIGHTACGALGVSGLLSTIGTLRLFSSTLSAQGIPPAGNDFKALVCVFLYGGNDANNTVIPYDTSAFSRYQYGRDILALPRTGLLPLSPVVSGGDGRQFALHPSLTRLQPLFNTGRLAVLHNVGTLVAPITKAEYLSGGAAIPPYLFSHNDQQVQWQTSVPDSPRKVGWGGRLADHLQSLNAGSQISMNVSIAGSNFFQVGNEVFQYEVTPDGSIGLNDSTATWSPWPETYRNLNDTLALSYGHIFEQHYARTMQRAIANDTLLRGVLSTIPSYQEKFAGSVDADGNPTWIGRQLRMVLRMVSARAELGMRRQIYFCAFGGFDTHDDQINDHAALLKQLGDALGDFHQATVDLGVSERVTTFTASDFNRTYNSNGRGSDHAWGGAQFVLGGTVRGGRFYGAAPVGELSGPDDTGNRGAWIPSVSTDEMASTLARWFGVAEGDLPLVLPNIGRFARPDLGFLNPA
jgi:uncharacterized protein (DUF1501 family)